MQQKLNVRKNIFVVKKTLTFEQCPPNLIGFFFLLIGMLHTKIETKCMNRYRIFSNSDLATTYPKISRLLSFLVGK